MNETAFEGISSGGAENLTSDVDYWWVDSPEELQTLVERMGTAHLVAIDTEFMREKTYYPQLCLIQVAFNDTVALIDAIALNDLTPLAAVFCKDEVLKIFHAGSQDFEILYTALGKPVAPLFDTQCAAALIGLPEQIGYGGLVQELLGISLAKGDSFTDWSRRPLTEAQLRYARDDVRYLLAAFPEVIKRLDELGRSNWLDEEFAYKASLDYLETDPRKQWKRVKKVSTLSRRQSAVAREIGAWREVEAMRLNIPRRWILADESIIEISRRQPKSRAELEAIRGVGPAAMRQARSILDAVSLALGLSEEELPTPHRKKRPRHDIDASVDLMVALARLRAKQNNIALSQLASRQMLEEFAENQEPTSPLLHGWRHKMIGQELLQLLNGELALTLVDNELVVTSLAMIEE